MNGKAFIRMMREDIETHKNKAVLSSVVDAMEYVVNGNLDCEIDSSKNAEDCYKTLFEAAKKTTGQGSGNTWCCISGMDAFKVIKSYLGLGDEPAEFSIVTEVSMNSTVNLEDFL